MRRAKSPVQRSSAPERRVVDPSEIQQLDHRLRHLLHPPVIRRRTADPVEHLEIRIRFNRRHIEPLGPSGTCSRAGSPHGLPERCTFCSETAGCAAQLTIADLKPPHVSDKSTGLTPKRTHVVARVANRTRPQRLRRDDITMQPRHLELSELQLVRTRAPRRLDQRRARLNCPRMSCTIAIGDSGLPASVAGQASVQRPQATQASRLISCRRVNSCTCSTPVFPVSSSSSSEIGTKCPSFFLTTQRFKDPATMCSSRVNGKLAMNPNTSKLCPHQVRKCGSETLLPIDSDEPQHQRTPPTDKRDLRVVASPRG